MYRSCMLHVSRTAVQKEVPQVCYTSKQNAKYLNNRILKGGVVIPLIFPKVGPPIFPNGILRFPQEHPLPLNNPRDP